MISSIHLLLCILISVTRAIIPNNNSSTNNSNKNVGNNNNNSINKNKRLILIRHGCTYANEYLAQPGLQWGDATFRDIPQLRDSPLSPRGIRQAMSLREVIERNSNSFQQQMGVRLDLQDIDLVVVSPLSRTLQTFELSLLPMLQKMNHNAEKKVPIVALPLARERLYMISDMGITTGELKVKFPWADFDSEFLTEADHTTWWYTPTSSIENDDDMWSNYVEWRPHGQGQQYLVPGEPDVEFAARMQALYNWLGSRSEQNIVLVCHWGTLEYLTGYDFDNCEVKIVNYDSLTVRVSENTQQREQEEVNEVVCKVEENVMNK